MSDKPPYTKREVDLMLSEIKTILRSTDDRSKAILEQTKDTNGRVTALEKWRAYILGAVGVLMFLGLPDVIQILSK